MEKYKERLFTLRNDLTIKVEEIRKNYPIIIFNTYDEYENGDCYEYIEVRNSINGETYDTHLLSVDNNGFNVVKSSDGVLKSIGFSEFASTLDMVIVCEWMQEKVKQFKNTQ